METKVDTIRLLIGMECNLNCIYCCNKLPEVKNRIREVKLNKIEWAHYDNVCISGGEPLMYMNRINTIIYDIDRHPFATPRIFLYTNGILFNKTNIQFIKTWPNLTAINIGLHPDRYKAKRLYVDTLDFICKMTRMLEPLQCPVRFDIDEKFRGYHFEYDVKSESAYSISDHSLKYCKRNKPRLRRKSND